MRTRAAVAVAAGKPLEIMEVQPRGAEGRRGAGRDQGDRHLPHRRVHPLGRRPRGAVPGDPRPRGRRHRRRRRPRRHQREEGRPRHPALHARVPAVPLVPVAQDQPLHRDPRHAGPGPDAGRHLALLDVGGEKLLHYMGTLDLLQLHRAAGDRGGEDPRGRALRQGLLHRLRGDDRHRRGASTPPRSSRAPRRSCSGSAGSASTSSRGSSSRAPT